jgi:hypothetical protein
METWLKSKSYRVGFEADGEGVNATKELWKTRIAVGAMKLGLHALGVHLPANQMFHRISGGAKGEALENAVFEFEVLSPLVGWSVMPMPNQNAVFLIVFADTQTPELILTRCEEFMKAAPGLAKLGFRVNGQRCGIVVRVLLAYYDEAKYFEHIVALRSEGTKMKFFAKVYIQTGFVLISKGYVRWTNTPGILGFFEKEPSKEPFTMEEAFEVLGLSKKGT